MICSDYYIFLGMKNKHLGQPRTTFIHQIPLVFKFWAFIDFTTGTFLGLHRQHTLLPYVDVGAEYL